MVFRHARRRDVVEQECLEVDKIAGSANSIAVAGTVLGRTNVPGSDDEKTDNTVAPGIPDANNETSAPTNGFQK